MMRGKEVVLRNVSITYPNGFTAVNPTDLTIRAGEFFSILGPSGCGKTTVLRAISGFVEPSTGSILLGGRDQIGLGPNDRETALIFQNLALFPLMSVAENVAFGLEARGMMKSARLKKARELLDLVALSDQAEKKPAELSGGQRQRVAIARALAVEPAVLLLDEPLSALDLKLRQHMRAELRTIQRQTGVTFIYITHDQGEALTMSDRIAVMNEGKIEQIGTGDEIYSDPQTAFVASFVGETNRITGKIVSTMGELAVLETSLGKFRCRNPNSLTEGEEGIVFIRPEAMRWATAKHANPNSLAVEIIRRELEGPFINMVLRAKDGSEWAIHQVNTGNVGETGQQDSICFAPEQAVILRQGKTAKSSGEEHLAA